jgi:hypothetical protein
VENFKILKLFCLKKCLIIEKYFRLKTIEKKNEKYVSYFVIGPDYCSP